MKKELSRTTSFKKMRPYQINARCLNLEFVLTNTKSNDVVKLSGFYRLVEFIRNEQLQFDEIDYSLSNDGQDNRWELSAPQWARDIALFAGQTGTWAGTFYFYYEYGSKDDPADSYCFFNVHEDKISKQFLCVCSTPNESIPDDLFVTCEEYPLTGLKDLKIATAYYWYEEFYTQTVEGGIHKKLLELKGKEALS